MTMLALSKAKVLLVAHATTMVIAAKAPMAYGAPSDPWESKIVGGQEVPASQTDGRRVHTVALTTDVLRGNTAPLDDGKSFCTGTIIAPNAIVTAAHCLQKFDPETHEKLDELILPQASDFIIHFGTKIEKTGKWVRALQVIPHPDWSPRDTLSPAPSEAPSDIGIVILEAPIPSFAKPAQIAAMDDTLNAGDQIHLVGYGVTTSRNNNDTGILRQVATSFKTFDFEAKRFSVGAFMRGACAGDSGGPAYLFKNGQYVLMGATSTGAEVMGYCMGMLNNYTDVRAYKNWVMQTIADYQ